MATKRTPGSRPGLIYCENCGEEYSSSYRRCPFCDEFGEDYEPDAGSGEQGSSRRSGGKRLTQSTRRGGGYTKMAPLQVIKVVLSLAIIIAAIWIVVSEVSPLIQRGKVDTIDPGPSNTETANPSPSPDTSPVVTDPPTVDPSPTPDVTPSVDPNAAIGFTLSHAEFAFTDEWPGAVTLAVTYSPAGSTGEIQWATDNPEVATVDAYGKVSHGTKKGTATITATLGNGVTQTCKVYNKLTSLGGNTGTGTGTGTGSGTVSTTYKVNNPDFTLFRNGETFRLKVPNYTGSVSWVSSNPQVATVSSDGTCKAVWTGTCTVTGTLDDGSTVEAIVRVKIS